MKRPAALVPYWHLSVDDVIARLSSDLERGLTQPSAEERLKASGPNMFAAEARTTSWRIIFDLLTSPLILILILAAVLTASLKHYHDTVFIAITVVVNTLLGFWQEYKAERAIGALKTYLKERTRVVRDGVEREIDSVDLVPGDLIRLAQGDRVPADARLTYENDLSVDEAVLTGEAMPVHKRPLPAKASATTSDQTSMLFAGTLVTQGFATAVVCRTGASTELGAIAALVSHTTRETTPLQRMISSFTAKLSVVMIVMTIGVFVIGVYAGEPLFDMFLTSVAIAVAAIPEGLPVSMTVILAVGVERMAKRKGVVRKLVAAEALGSTTLILTDKTGTLTEARMSLARIVPLHHDEATVFAHALVNTNVLVENPDDTPEDWRIDGRIMEVSLARAAGARGLSLTSFMDKSRVVQTVSFNSAAKYSVSLVDEGGASRLVLLGAPDVLLDHTTLSQTEKDALLAQIHELASAGERVLGVASAAVSDPTTVALSRALPEVSLSLDGLITFRDPVRKDVAKTIQQIHHAGVRTIILTGDHLGTAMAVARELGFTLDPRAVIEARELATLGDDELAKRLPHLSVIARVTPADKLRIAKLYQAAGEIVAMTGDGVNDAPSIKQADVGIAMGSGTEVAQSVADLVLLDDNFGTIAAAIEEGRQIVNNIRKVLVYLLSNITDDLILIGGALVIGIPLPLNALQILWVNFFSDSFPAIAFAFERDGDVLSHRAPRGRLTLFTPLMKFLVLIIGLLTSAMLLVVYWWLLAQGHDESLVRTFIFASFGSYSLFVALSVRHLHNSIFRYSLFSNHFMTGGIAIGIVVMLAAVYLPSLQSLLGTVALPAVWALGVLAIGVANIALIEAAKKFFSLSDYAPLA